MTNFAEEPARVGLKRPLARWILAQRVRSPILRYGLSVVCVAVAVGLALAFQFCQFRDVALPVLCLAVGIATWYAGVGPSVVALLLSTACFNYFFVAPFYSFSVGTRDLPYFFTFLAWALIVSWFSIVSRRIEEGLRQARDRLQVELEQRVQREDEIRSLNRELATRAAELEARVVERTADLQRLAAIVESSNDAIGSKDLNGIITSWNKGAERLFGYTTDEIIGKPVTILIPAERHDEERVILERIRRGEPIDHYETSRCRKDGTLVDISLTVSPVTNADGRIIGASTIARDITDRKQAERVLHQAQAELAHVNRVATMGQLAASIAHEVKQPIAAAVTSAQAALRWLGARPPDLDEVRQALGRIVEDGKRAGDVIDRVRALIKKAPQRKDWFDLNQAVLDVIALTRSVVLSHRVSLRTQLAAGLPLIGGDRVQVQQVVLNLVLNAVEAMSTDSDGLRDLLISTEQGQEDEVLVAVRDSGPGIDPDVVEHVFQSFYTTKPSGMGMGLSICRSIAEAHGGRLGVNANKPRGAIFQFILPVEADSAS